MNEFVRKIREKLAAWKRSTATFWRANRMLALGGLTVLSILLVVWARLGFTFEIGRFFAGSLPPPGTLTVQCTGSQAVLSWNIPAGSTVNAIQKNINGQGWQFIFQEQQLPYTVTSTTDTFTPTTVYRHKSDPNVVSNLVQCPPPSTPTATPSASATPTPTASPAATPGPTTTPTVSINTIPETLQGQALGTISGAATDAVGVQEVHVVIRRNPGAGGACITGSSQDWNGSQWIDGCTVAGQITPVFTPATSVQWSTSSTPPLAQMTPGTYRVFAGAFRSRTPLIWSGYAMRDVVYSIGTPTPTPTPTPAALACAPLQQTVNIGQGATFDAAGGTAPYQWSVVGGIPAEGAGNTFSSTFAGAGTYTVVLTDTLLQRAECTVVVSPNTVTPTPTITPVAGTFTMTVSGRNFSTGSSEDVSVSALGGQQVEVVTRLVNTSSQTTDASGQTNDPVTNITPRVRATLPGGLVYVAGSTSVNNAASSDAIVSGGLQVGTLGPGQDAVVRFRVRVNGASFPAGQSQAVVSVAGDVDGVQSQNGSLTVIVNRPVTGGQPGAVQTGPGDAVFVALLISAIMTLLYVSYTHSPMFRRHEVDRVSDDQGPLDFRS